MRSKLKTSWLRATDYLVGSRHSGDGSRFESRLRRLLIWVPLAGTVLLLLWTYGVREPRAGYLLTRHHDLIALEEAINLHRLRISEQQYADLQVKLRDTELFILPDAIATGRLLEEIATQAASAGWTPLASTELPTAESIPGLPDLQLVTHPLSFEHSSAVKSGAATALPTWLEQLNSRDQRVDILGFHLESTGPDSLQLRLRLGFVQRATP